MSIKLIAIDIDGTLLNDNHEITPDVYDAIQKAKEKGIKVVITTGRPLPGVTAMLEELNLMDEGDYVIVYNGGLVQETATGRELVRLGLTHEDYLEIDYTARKHNVHMHAITNDTIYTSNRNLSRYTVQEAYLVKMPVHFRTPEEITEKHEIVKAMFIDEPEILDEVIPQISKEFKEKFNTVKSTPFYYEILNKKASKGAAMLKLAEVLGIEQSETMAIGDEENDISMLEVAGLAVAMGNATDKVKAISHVETTSNNEHGVARAIEKYAL